MRTTLYNVNDQTNVIQCINIEIYSLIEEQKRGINQIEFIPFTFIKVRKLCLYH